LIPVAGVSKNLFKADDAYDIYKAAKKGDALNDVSETASKQIKISTHALLDQVEMQKHHIFPQKYRDFFQGRGIDIDKFTVDISQNRHLRSIHGLGDAISPGKYNQTWDNFIEANPNATAKEIYQYGGRLMDGYGLNKLPIVPYR
jgi:hypothetical protein